MSPTLRALSAALLLASLPAGLCAQATADSLTPHVVPGGDRVRVMVPMVSTHWQEGTLMRADGDSVLVYRRRGGLLAVPTWQVERMQRAAGRDHAAGAIHGLGMGFLAAIPVLMLLASEKNEGGDGGGEAIVGLGALVILPPVGLVMGAIAGAPRWRDVPVPAARPPADSAATASAQ